MKTKKLASHHVMLINSTEEKRGKDKVTEEKMSTATKGRKKARKNEQDTEGGTGQLTMGTSPRDFFPKSLWKRPPEQIRKSWMVLKVREVQRAGN